MLPATLAIILTTSGRAAPSEAEGKNPYDAHVATTAHGFCHGPVILTLNAVKGKDLLFFGGCNHHMASDDRSASLS